MDGVEMESKGESLDVDGEEDRRIKYRERKPNNFMYDNYGSTMDFI
jgi:hypothetical protein